VEWHESLGSTSDVARERAREGSPSWTAILAGRQTAGRGRHGRPWVSEPGNVYVSVLLRPAGWPAEAIATLPLLAGVAVAEALGEWGIEARLKWPNDVWVGERKIAGLLAEASSGAAGVESVVLGLGVNVAHAPESVAATCLSDAIGRAPSLFDVAAAVLAALRRRVEELAPKGSAAVVAAWREHAVDWRGRLVEVESGGSRLLGRYEGIADDGALLLSGDRGTMRIVSGEARALRPAAGTAEDERP
jgi:BirA family biotin operon repressor/biotin-[acetyl-CoA-carboxylase] ligase